MIGSPDAPGEAPLTPHRGSLVLTLGIVGVVICWPLGIVVLVMARRDLRAIDAGLMDPTGRGMTVAALVLGVVGICLTVLAILNLVAFMALMPAPDGRSYEVAPIH